MKLTKMIGAAALVSVLGTAASAGEWNGLYGGLSLGYGKHKAASLTYSDKEYGLHAGYLMDRGSFVWGGELSYLKTNKVRSGVRVKSYTDLKLRLGYDAGRFLPTFNIGMSRASVESVGGAISTKANALLLGVGLDYQLSDHAILGAEYTHRRFDSGSNSVIVKVSYKF